MMTEPGERNLPALFLQNATYIMTEIKKTDANTLTKMYNEIS